MLDKWFAQLISRIAYEKNDLETGEKDPGSVSFFSVTVRRPVTKVSSAALAYSYFPFALFLGFGFWFVCFSQMFPFLAAVIMAFSALVSEYILKRIVKQPRPLSSAVRSYGMPSSHCTVAYCLLVWILFEAFSSTIATIPTLAVCSVSAAALAPVPWARYYLDDHSMDQCVAGSCVGALLGCGCYAARSIVLYPSVTVL